MRQIKSIIFLSILIIITPFLGVPSSWKEFIHLLIGFLILIISMYVYLEKRNKQVKGNDNRVGNLFIDNNHSNLTDESIKEV